MKRVAFGIALLAFGVATAGAVEYKIGTVDLQRALNESAAGKKAKEEFKVEVDKLQADLEGQKTALEQMKADFEKKGMVLKEDQRKEMEREYQRRLRDFQRTYKDSQAELQARDNELTAEILRQLQEVILEYGPRNDYTIILEASNTGAVLYNSEAVDVTSDIISAYDNRWKSAR